MRRTHLAVATSLLTVLLSAALAGPGGAAEPAAVTVYKSPACGCCVKWIEHLEDHGFQVKAVDVFDTAALKREHEVPPALQTCHTATVDGYVVEGHVPAADVERLLRERPEVRGLAVPGMPIGSPGMEGPNPESYSTLSFDAEGRTRVFETHGP